MTETPSASEQTTHFISLLRKFRTAMLVTETTPHGFHARPMLIANVDDDGRLWFLTADGTAKVHEIESKSQVHVMAQDGDSAFVSLTGRAVFTTDRGAIARLWKEPFRVWFPKGREDPNIKLITIRPQKGEFWDVTGANRCKYLWESAKACFTGTTPDPREGELHGKVEL